MRKLTRLAIPFVMLVSSFAVVSSSAVPVQAAPAGATVVYNLFATDAYIPLADGRAIYNYGFVGGRAGVPLIYQKSVTPATNADAQGLKGYTYNGVVTVASGAPAPTGGPVAELEKQFQGNAQFPAPLIYLSVGDVLEIHLKNLGTTNPTAPNDPHSIHLHGLDVDAANDGVPETSIGAVPANLCADGTTNNDCSANGGPAAGAGNVIVYMAAPQYAGTTMYHCHQEADIHVQMGMYGALVVYNRGDAAAISGPGSGKGGILYGWKYDKDYVLLESEIGVAQHTSEETAGDYNPVDYHPAYWFLNGLSFPNTIHVGLPEATPGTGWSDWISSHPGYDPFITGSVSKRHLLPISNGEKVLIRMINMGYETQPMHMHGFHGKVIGSDQRAWYWANTPGQSPTGVGMEKNTLTIGSGETYDWLIDFGTVSVTSTYPQGTQTRYDPNGNLPKSNTLTQLPAIQNPDNVDYVAGPKVSGANGLPTPGQLYPFHNHDDYKATNNGTYPGGMFTMIMPTQ